MLRYNEHYERVTRATQRSLWDFLHAALQQLVDSWSLTTSGHQKLVTKERLPRYKLTTRIVRAVCVLYCNASEHRILAFYITTYDMFAARACTTILLCSVLPKKCTLSSPECFFSFVLIFISASQPNAEVSFRRFSIRILRIELPYTIVVCFENGIQAYTKVPIFERNMSTTRHTTNKKQTRAPSFQTYLQKSVGFSISSVSNRATTHKHSNKKCAKHSTLGCATVAWCSPAQCS